jgi:squalene-hopene/tetraprenyl-beta-curcumene cyclase
MQRSVVGLVIVGWIAVLGQPLWAGEGPTDAQVKQAVAKAVAYLQRAQAEDGHWQARPALGVTGLVTAALLDRPGASADDPTIAKALKYIVSKVQPDGGIYDRMLQTYTTGVCLSALARVGDEPDMQPIIRNAQKYLGSLQWTTQEIRNRQGQVLGKCDESHAFYGGVGYGPGSRPDLSNTAMMLEALHDSGMDCNDPVFKRAVAFVSGLQAVEGNKHLAGKTKTNDGGFVYVQEPRRGRGRPTISGASEEHLTTYGSMTHAGFMSYAYAQLDAKDPRVMAAAKWIGEHYTFEVNPGMAPPNQKAGLYYYYLLFARAMKAWGKTTITTPDGVAHRWADELVAKIVSLQREDGSWVNSDSDRWGEGDPILVTAYALHVLNHAGR